MPLLSSGGSPTGLPNRSSPMIKGQRWVAGQGITPMLQFGAAEPWDARTARRKAQIAARRKDHVNKTSGVIATAWHVNTDGCPAGVHAGVEYEEQSFSRMMEVELPKALAAAATKTLAGSPHEAMDKIGALGRLAPGEDCDLYIKVETGSSTHFYGATYQARAREFIADDALPAPHRVQDSTFWVQRAMITLAGPVVLRPGSCWVITTRDDVLKAASGKDSFKVLDLLDLGRPTTAACRNAREAAAHLVRLLTQQPGALKAMPADEDRHRHGLPCPMPHACRARAGQLGLCMQVRWARIMQLARMPYFPSTAEAYGGLRGRLFVQQQQQQQDQAPAAPSSPASPVAATGAGTSTAGGAAPGGSGGAYGTAAGASTSGGGSGNEGLAAALAAADEQHAALLELCTLHAAQAGATGAPLRWSRILTGPQQYKHAGVDLVRQARAEQDAKLSMPGAAAYAASAPGELCVDVRLQGTSSVRLTQRLAGGTRALYGLPGLLHYGGQLLVLASEDGSSLVACATIAVAHLLTTTTTATTITVRDMLEAAEKSPHLVAVLDDGGGASVPPQEQLDRLAAMLNADTITCVAQLASARETVKVRSLGVIMGLLGLSVSGALRPEDAGATRTLLRHRLLGAAVDAGVEADVAAWLYAGAGAASNSSSIAGAAPAVDGEDGAVSDSDSEDDDGEENGSGAVDSMGIAACVRLHRLLQSHFTPLPATGAWLNGIIERQERRAAAMAAAVAASAGTAARQDATSVAAPAAAAAGAAAMASAVGPVDDTALSAGALSALVALAPVEYVDTKVIHIRWMLRESFDIDTASAKGAHMLMGDVERAALQEFFVGVALVRDRVERDGGVFKPWGGKVLSHTKFKELMNAGEITEEVVVAAFEERAPGLGDVARAALATPGVDCHKLVASWWSNMGLYLPKTGKKPSQTSVAGKLVAAAVKAARQAAAAAAAARQQATAAEAAADAGAAAEQEGGVQPAAAVAAAAAAMAQEVQVEGRVQVGIAEAPAAKRQRV